MATADPGLGRSTPVFEHPPHTLTDLLEEGRRHGDATWFVYEGDRWTHGGTHEAALGLAAQLASTYGIGKGDRVAVAMRNYPEFGVFFWATMALGAVLVPLNAWWTPDALVDAVVDSGSVVLAADGERLRALDGRLDGLGLRVVIAVRADAQAHTAVAWEDLRARLDPTAHRTVPVHPDDPATILYTSGTTGRPKGAVHTHRNHLTGVHVRRLAAARAATREAAAGVAEPQPGQAGVLATMPLFHVSQLTSLYTTYADGAKFVTMRRWDAEQALDLVERERLTALSGVPMQIEGLISSPTVATRDLRSLRFVAFAATKAPVDLIRAVTRALPGRTLRGGYGMTESTGAVTTIEGMELEEHPGSVGRPTVVNEIRIVDDHGVDVEVGQPGELWVRGPNVVAGYWSGGVVDTEDFADGWHRSGDVARFDDAGRVHILDRLKDVIIRAGENVYCAQVESVLAGHPAVVAAAVVGRPHPLWGEEVVGVVTIRAGVQVTAEDLRQFCAGRLPGFSVPTTFVVDVAPLPVGATGKVRKDQVRMRVAELGREGGRGPT